MAFSEMTTKERTKANERTIVFYGDWIAIIHKYALEKGPEVFTTKC